MNILIIIAIICFAAPGLAIFFAYLSKMSNFPWPNMWKRIAYISLAGFILGGALIGISYAIS